MWRRSSRWVLEQQHWSSGGILLYVLVLLTMGALCSKGATTKNKKNHSEDEFDAPFDKPELDEDDDHHLHLHLHHRGLAPETKSFSASASPPTPSSVSHSGELLRAENEAEEKLGFKLAQERSLESVNSFEKMKLSRVLSNKARSARNKTTIVARRGAAKVSEVGLLLGRAGTMSLGKAVEALDTVGSSLTTIGSGFGSGVTPKGNKIGILAFEVANTIVRGFNLMHSLSDEDIRVLKEEILPSEAVQRLISRDMDELWRIAASDKRSDLKVFTKEVVRFGNHCRDPRWHQLCRVFDKLGSEVSIPRQSKEAAEAEMENLMLMAQQTAELYHELHALDRFHNDLKRKLQQEEEMYNASQRGDSIAMLKGDLKAQQKHVKNLKRKSLWSKIIEEVMEKLVDIVYFLHQRIYDIFGPAADATKVYEKEGICRLGPSGLALHYANIINQIDNLVSRPNSVPPNTRDTLYQGLPPNIKAALRTRLQIPRRTEELTIPQIKAEMEKILDWLAPVAVNTARAHHGFGWVGEWANSGSVLDRRLPGHTELIRLQTLHHAEQSTTESYILELIVWLNVLVSCARSNINGHRSPFKSPSRSPVAAKPGDSRKLNGHHLQVYPLGESREKKHEKEEQQARQSQASSPQAELSQEDQEMLKDVVVQGKRRTPGISKSQEFNTSKSKAQSCSKSSSAKSSSPRYKRHSANNLLIPPLLDLDIDRINDIESVDRASSDKRCGN